MSEERTQTTNPRPQGPRRGPGRGMMPGEKAKDFKGTIKKLIKYMGRYKYAILAVMIFAVGSTIFHVIGPKIISKATTELFNGMMAKVAGTGGIDFGRVAQILLFLLGNLLLIQMRQLWQILYLVIYLL